MVNQGQEFVPGFLACPEPAQHGAGDRPGMLFFHAAHHHAEMPGFANHADSHRVDGVLNGLRHLLRQARCGALQYNRR